MGGYYAIEHIKELLVYECKEKAVVRCSANLHVILVFNLFFHAQLLCALWDLCLSGCFPLI